MKKLATKLTPAIKELIEDVWGSDFYNGKSEDSIFNFPNNKNYNGFLENWHLDLVVFKGYTEVSEQEFLAEFGKPKDIFQIWEGEWLDYLGKCRIKPTPDYSKEIEALQQKAKENGMRVIVGFEKL